MNTVWIFVVFFCCISQVLSHFSEKPLDEVNSSDYQNHKVQNDEVNLNLFRLRESPEAKELFDENIANNYNKYSSDVNDLSTANIAKEVFNSNEIDPLNTLLSSCPSSSSFANVIHTIKVFGMEPFQVLCNSDIAGPGWTVIASRSNKELNFFRGWQDYKVGFGNLTGDFFIGLDKLHAITVSQVHELFIYLEDFEGNKRFARYDVFLIDPETNKYAISKLGTYHGNMGDALTRLKGMKFSTLDSNNDTWNGNCAVERIGAWWYKDCADSNLFGAYLKGNSVDLKGMYWLPWRGSKYSYKEMRMMVKPKCSC